MIPHFPTLLLGASSFGLIGVAMWTAADDLIFTSAACVLGALACAGVALVLV